MVEMMEEKKKNKVPPTHLDIQKINIEVRNMMMSFHEVILFNCLVAISGEAEG